MNEIIVALIIGPVAGFVGGFTTWLVTRRKNNAETGLTIDQRWERLADEYGERLDKAEKRVDVLSSQVAELAEHLDRSEAKVRRLTALLRSTARWALTLQREISRLGGSVPEMPADVEFALTTLDPPD